MKTLPVWSEKIPDMEGRKTPVNDIAFRPDGTELVVAAGSRVVVFSAGGGEPVHNLKGHKDTVYCVSYSRDQKRFASGGADKTVIIWTSKAEGILKYQHSDSIQCLCYNPVTHQLASATATDFGLWSMEQKSVAKHKVPSKVLCCAWTNDGHLLALGMLSGVVSLRNKTGEEKVSIKRGGPVWSVSWNPAKEEADTLAVASWDQRLSFYHVSGKATWKERELPADPCCVSYFTNGEYLLVGGSDRKVTLFTKEGIKLSTVTEVDDWVWAIRQRPKQNFIAVGTNDGHVNMVQLSFSTVHSLYQDMYAHREVMTDVVVQQLVTDRRMRIKCKDYVKRIAIYKDRLAVQLPEKILIYETTIDDSQELKHKLRERILRKVECNLLVVTSNHIVLCLDKKLQLLDFAGNRRREWIVDATIRYIKAVGGPPDRECLLVGVKSGSILKIFIDNPFPVTLLKLNSCVRCLDMSLSRQKLAVVDEFQVCSVYDLNTKELIYQENNANCIAWNSEFEDLLCFSGNNMIGIKTGNLPTSYQKLPGFVVGFKGSKIFCLHSVNMVSIDVPQSHAMYRYVDLKDFASAYRIACLGVTERDWRTLAVQALLNLNFTIARKAFVRMRDVRFIELLNRIELERKGTAPDDNIFMAEIHAFQGNFIEAGRCFQRAGQEERAKEMFCDLKMWDEAKAMCPGDDTLKDLLRRQARWAEDVGDYQEACKLYITAGDFTQAIAIAGERGWMDKLEEISKALPKSENASLGLCGTYFRRHGAHSAARDVFVKLGDVRSLLQLHVEMQHWEDAFALLEYSGIAQNSEVYVPYAEYLAMNDDFDGAQEALKKADRPHEALRMTEQLVYICITENRFKDAAYYMVKLAIENVRFAVNGDNVQWRVDRHATLLHHSELYFAYHFVAQYMDMPFTPTDPSHLFYMARYLTAGLMNMSEVPPGIDKMKVVYALAKLSRQLGMFKLSRWAYERLAHFVLPRAIVEQVELAMAMTRAKPYTDKDELCPMCYRCGTLNPAYNHVGDECVNCLQPFVRSFFTFEVLPLVEFRLGHDLTDAQAEHIISSVKVQGRRRGSDAGRGGDVWTEHKGDGVEVMTFGDDPVLDEGGADVLQMTSNAPAADPFKMLAAMEQEIAEGAKKRFQPVYVDSDNLKQFKRDEIFVQRWPGSETGIVRPRYYRNMVPEVSIVQCASCNHFFHEEDFEFECLKSNGCPYCRAPRET
eukprot:PhM_4_TR1421/c0_g1_i1/m.66679/K19656/IFT122; intraflagellar transport protein 122